MFYGTTQWMPKGNAIIFRHIISEKLYNWGNKSNNKQIFKLIWKLTIMIAFVVALVLVIANLNCSYGKRIIYFVVSPRVLIAFIVSNEIEIDYMNRIVSAYVKMCFLSITKCNGVWYIFLSRFLRPIPTCVYTNDSQFQWGSRLLWSKRNWKLRPSP